MCKTSHFNIITDNILPLNFSAPALCLKTTNIGKPFSVKILSVLFIGIIIFEVICFLSFRYKTVETALYLIIGICPSLPLVFAAVSFLLLSPLISLFSLSIL